jgi:hypothetical protein
MKIKEMRIKKLINGWRIDDILNEYEELKQ